MLNDTSSGNSTAQSPSPEEPWLNLSGIYGAQVAKEAPIIERVLRTLAAARGHDLREGDFDSFCRGRRAKINRHRLQKKDDSFERVRLLNMLYEECLARLEKAAHAYGESPPAEASEELQRVEAIILHLTRTLDYKQGVLPTELLRLYDFAWNHLALARKEKSVEKIRDVERVIEQIYLGYLEIEIQQDADAYLTQFSEHGLLL